MKKTGITRKIDELGRIVIPKEIRKINKLWPGTAMEIFVSEGGIMLRPYRPGCCFCGAAEKKDLLVLFKGQIVCRECRKGVAVARPFFDAFDNEE